jgi:hypothetical protein
VFAGYWHGSCHFNPHSARKGFCPQMTSTWVSEYDANGSGHVPGDLHNRSKYHAAHLFPQKAAAPPEASPHSHE